MPFSPDTGMLLDVEIVLNKKLKKVLKYLDIWKLFRTFAL